MKLINLLIERENLQTQLNNLKSSNKFDSQTIANRIPIIKRLFAIDGLIAKFSKIERYEAQEKIRRNEENKKAEFKSGRCREGRNFRPYFFLMLVEMIFQNKDFNTKYFIALSLNQILGATMKTERDIKRELINEEIKKEEEWKRDKAIIIFSFLIAIIIMSVMNVYFMSVR